MITEKQRLERLNYIGASDSPIICGYSSYLSAYELYKIKRRELEPKEAGERADIGNLLESAIADIFTYKTGMGTTKSTETIFHPDYDFIACNLDRTITDKNLPLEIKNTTQADEWGEEIDGPNGIPVSVHIQVQHQMSCCGAEIAAVACLLFGTTLKIYDVPRDDELIGMILDKDIKFWKCVKSGTPPPIQYNHPTTQDLLRRVFKGTNGQIIDLPEDCLAWHKKLVEETVLAKQHDSLAKGYKARIMAKMGENAIGKLSDGTCYKRKANKNGVINMKHSKYVPGE